MNKLIAKLPSSMDEVVELGFKGNIAESGGKYVTDGHSMFLKSAAPEGMEFDEPEEWYFFSATKNTTATKGTIN